MSIRSRKDPISSSEAELKRYINDRHDDLKLYAQYFANSPKALQTKVIDVDSAGFTLQYADLNQEGEMVLKDVRIPFDVAVRSEIEVKEKFAALAKEARTALSLAPSKKYLAPGRIPTFEFEPPAKMVTTFLALWFVLLAGAFLPLPHVLEFYRYGMGGNVLFEQLLKGVLALHGVEALVVFGFGIFGSFPIVDLVAAVFYTLFFGVACLGPTIKIATKRNLALARERNEITIG
ncbi:hypothetical protein DFS34DRAFT_577026 [Phlyctochytrium arcticum]|nr:hypothetical protein DFS34DRAFT_577026 [Phlyctochytrium arcticum]